MARQINVAELVIWTEAPPSGKPVRLLVVERGRVDLTLAAIEPEEFERVMSQWLALSGRKIVNT